MNDYTDRLKESIERFRARSGSDSFRAALIDMDGTLYDSMKNHTAAWHRMMSELGIVVDRDRFYLFEGMTGRQTINTLFGEFLGREATDSEVEELYHRKTVYFNELPSPAPMPGADRFLSSLRDAGITRVLVTGSGQRSLIDRLNRDYPGIFSEDMMITSRDVVHGKPNPEPYLRAMERAGVTAAESVVVENAPLGVKAGADSGAFTVGLTTGPIPAKELQRAGADIVLPSMEALADLSYILFKTTRL